VVNIADALILSRIIATTGSAGIFGTGVQRERNACSNSDMSLMESIVNGFVPCCQLSWGL